MVTAARLPSRDTLGAYHADIGRTPLLSAAEERELAAQVATGDVEARDQMVRANLRLVVNIARRFAGRGLPLEDLVAEGNLGLLRAVEGFDPNMSTRLSTYAAFWVEQSIRRALLAAGRVARVPHYATTMAAKWRRAAAALAEELGRAPTDAEVADRAGLGDKQAAVARRALRINAGDPTGDGDDAGWLAGMAPDTRAEEPGDRLAATEEVGAALRAVGRLDAREAAVLRMRYGLGGDAPMTLDAIGAALGVTRQRAQQIEKDALAALRQLMRDGP